MAENEHYYAAEPVSHNTRRTIDDEQLKRMLKQSEPRFTEKYFYCIATLILIALNVVVYLVEVVLSGFSVDISGMVLYDMGAMYVPAIQSVTDLYRFVTPMFLHIDLMHLVFNMAALYSVGVMLEQVLGKKNFVLLYFIAGITGNVVSYVTDIVTGSFAISAGASTSIFGLFIAVALLGLLSKNNRAWFSQYSKGMLSIIALNVLYSLAMPSVSLSGHLGGALGGLIGMYIVPSKNLRVPTIVRIVVALAWVAVMVWIMSGSWLSFLINLLSGTA